MIGVTFCSNICGKVGSVALCLPATGSTHMMGEDDVPEEIDRAEGDPDDPSAEAVPEEDWLTGNLSRQHALERRAATRIQAVWPGHTPTICLCQRWASTMWAVFPPLDV